MKKIIKKINEATKKRAFHISVIMTSIVILIFIAIITILKYNVEGEKEMPFEISKINVISTVGGESIETQEVLSGEEAEAKWNINIDQNNDFYIYISKNENYNGRTNEVIDSIKIENFEIEKKTETGKTMIYKPDATSEKELFKNKEENIVESLEYIGASETNIKNLQMANQGDLIYFRITNKNIEKYTSNDEEIKYNELLKKLNYEEEKLETKIKFDMTINLTSKKSFKTTISANVPVEGIVENGTTSAEIIDVNKLIFKRN